MTPITIYHNPDCGTSRNVLAALQALRLNPMVIEYLKAPPDAGTLKSLITAASMSVRDAIRVKGTPYKELGLDGAEWSDDALIEQTVRHPILINRPLVVTGKGVRLCRPSDVVLDLVDTPHGIRLEKEEGVPFLGDTLISSEAVAAGQATPVQFYAYRATDGAVLAHASVALQGTHALVHTLTVDAAHRGQGLGHNVLALLLRRAFEQGARRAWVSSDTAGAFFGKSGFKTIDRGQAPSAVLAAGPPMDTNASTPTLYTRQISL
ncbi:arsenate reductase (glutaredoxin) [Achromobacter aloeverae]|uniref:Arsenate reductase n=1 Tax=Achromobacter aloeverae TaxID=1750518 RepID=A0A4Q1HPF3_9BURK|nr:arsenate reductase (glutaredoxin) [Achromobacter aloeverae]RXN92226.1 arsenate reductase (glutaredoxin) [Achromobacter aloeverae]